MVLLLDFLGLYSLGTCSGFELKHTDGNILKYLSDKNSGVASISLVNPGSGEIGQQYLGNIPAHSPERIYTDYDWYNDLAQPNLEDIYDGHTQLWDGHSSSQDHSSLMFHPPYHQAINTMPTMDHRDILTSIEPHSLTRAFKSTYHEIPESSQIEQKIEDQMYTNQTPQQIRYHLPESEIENIYGFSDSMHCHNQFPPEIIGMENPSYTTNHFTMPEDYNPCNYIEHEHPAFHNFSPGTHDEILYGYLNEFPMLSSHPSSSCNIPIPKHRTPISPNAPLIECSQNYNNIFTQQSRSPPTLIHPHEAEEELPFRLTSEGGFPFSSSQLVDSMQERRTPYISEDFSSTTQQQSGNGEYNENVKQYQEKFNKEGPETLDTWRDSVSHKRKEVWDLTQDKEKVKTLTNGQSSNIESKNSKEVERDLSYSSQGNNSAATLSLVAGKQGQDISTSRKVSGHSHISHIGSFGSLRRGGGNRRAQFCRLQSVGTQAVNRSLTLSYSIYEWFIDLYRKMEMRFKGEIEGQTIHLAVKNAGCGVVMAFLGILKVFEYNDSGKDELERLLEDGWKYMKNFYDKWNDKEIHVDGKRDRHKGGKWSLDPQSQLLYLKGRAHIKEISLRMVHEMAIEFAKHRENSKIPKRFLTTHWEKLLNVYNTDSTSMEGGLYGRGQIRNNSFQAAEKLLRLNPKERKPYSKTEMASFASKAAQFHTPIGREMCKDVHIFFENLNHKLHVLYNDKEIYQSDQLLQPEDIKILKNKHEMNTAQIIKGVSMAQYKLTVVFIGLIRAFNEDFLSEDQIRLLLINAWDFLKKEFSQWERFDFQAENHSYLFNHDENSMKFNINDLNHPEAMFRKLSGFSNSYDVPRSCVVHLLKSWIEHIQRIKSGTEHFLDFPVQSFPARHFTTWKSYLNKL
ncbi:uncharacterized protein MELLADRAFT_63940 [Melampsora larici-populina 98AG31]|uniref:Uncharacterized protein n=1 Tax=Melampsora larici-populina (strain 98AG31 / pathotype 3-4-7) TaxID=747676 RepID=F4RPK1_MELLP|nr:uncharacterized protein MELLADRAFT_63940 [Melampsora larici-populina 98AG31]EGG05545.1 hypothetical protein MELLADRAFT_63940 [Melampsora larici-populina 98AG31]